MKSASFHSIESMGLVDGPGIRIVFFLQGCPLKCKYCHNPDSQHFMGTQQISTEEILAYADRYREYYESTGGGITFSGGEPLMQGAFLSEALKELKRNGYNTCVDTSGYGVPKYYETILEYTDTLLLDVKQFSDEAYEALTGRNMTGLLSFMDAIEQFDYQGKIVVRHVMVPGMTDSEAAMDKLIKMIAKISKRVEKIEILPYHKSGIDKYSQLGIAYELETVPEMSPQVATDLEKYVNKRFKETYGECQRAS